MGSLGSEGEAVRFIEGEWRGFGYWGRKGTVLGMWGIRKNDKSPGE